MKRSDLEPLLDELDTIEAAIKKLHQRVWQVVMGIEGGDLARRAGYDHACAGRKRYKSVEGARMAAIAKTVKQRFYECPFCGQYHLTKADLSEFAGVPPVAERLPASARITRKGRDRA